MLELSGVDLTPTILHLLGTAVPKGLDGRVMEEILEAECLERSPVRYRDSDLTFLDGIAKSQCRGLQQILR